MSKYRRLPSATAALLWAGTMGLGIPLAAQTTDEPKPYIVWPKDTATVTNPVTVIFGLRDFGVAPAGIAKPGTGHHHLLIDVAEPPPFGQPIPKDNQHRHFGGGQTQVTLELPPGEHTLQLMLGDHNHIAQDPSMLSEKITINVVK